MPEIRTAFGFARTECSCRDCQAFCHSLPGFLIPSDLETIAAVLGYDDLVLFAMENLLASIGATVLMGDRLTQIPTLVPQRKPAGGCKFFDDENRCTIHAVSPFGCAFFQSNMNRREADHRSSCGLQAIAREWAIGGLYARIWISLYSMGLIAPSPIHSRSQLNTSSVQRQ
jgi:hypothetical protein